MADPAPFFQAAPAQTALQQKLERLHHPAERPARVLEQILDLIDDTLLARRFRLRRSGQVLAHFVVCHRKLLSLEIAGQPVAPGDPSTAASQFARALLRLDQLTPGADVQFDHSGCTPPETALRCSATQLRRAINSVPRLSEAPGPEVACALDQALSWGRIAPQEAQSVTLQGDSRFHAMIGAVLAQAAKDMAPDRRPQSPNAVHITTPHTGHPGQATAGLILLPIRPDLQLVIKHCPAQAVIWAALFSAQRLPPPESLGQAPWP